jgi:predicted Zn-dependent peptidase
VLDELNAAAEKGVTEAEIARAKAGYETSFVIRLEGLRERASLLNMYQAELGKPDGAEEDLGRYRKVTKESSAKALSQVLQKPKVTVRVSPKAAGAKK